MLAAISIVFVLSYLCIALEHPLRISKTASALLGAGWLWSIYALFGGDAAQVETALNRSLMGTAQVVFFLMGAMVIVEVIDAHDGFQAITSRIRTTQLSSLLWLIGIFTFFLSSILDNLTTTIVMISLTRKLLDKADDRKFFAGIIVIAANAGGAWTAIGDVTTTMLWIGGQVTALQIMKSVFGASIVSLLVPLAVITLVMRGRPVQGPPVRDEQECARSTPFERNLMLVLGLGVLVGVPVFKSVTHLPPFLGILFGLGMLWMVGDLLHHKKDEDERRPLTLVHALSRIDMSSVIFFVGILMAVAVLEHTHILSSLAHWLDQVVGRQDVIVLLIGLLSAIVDNVPLVAATQGMYSLTQFPPDSFLWEFIAYCAGTGGSILIIGSAAGVAAMGLEKIDFIWYMRKISLYALIGYLGGAAAYIVQYQLLH